MFAVLHVAAFALHAVLRTEFDASGRAAALFSGHQKKSVIVSTTAAAHAAGVERGMSAAQAVARCPALLIRACNATAETEARSALLAVALTLAPAIEDTAPGICTIDLRGAAREKYFSAARAAVAQLNRLGLPATVGLARTPLLALYAARTTVDVLLVEDEKKFLCPLPLALADPSPELAGVLDHWGLRTFGEFSALPRDEIIRRFGAAGLALWHRASGGEIRPLRPVAPNQVFSSALEFEDPIATLEPLLFILRRFIDRLTLELEAAQFVAAELTLSLQLEDGSLPPRRFRLPEPTADPEILFRALHTHLESLHTDSAIVAVALQLSPTRPLVRQQGLFDTGLRDPHGFAETLARVSALVGPENLGTPQSEDTHRPDTFKLTPPIAIVPLTTEPPVHPAMGPPLRRFRPPLRVGLTETSDGKIFLWANGTRGEISHRSPPYYRDGEWWQTNRSWARVEWDVLLAEGGLYRLILDGADYFLEGEYD